MPQIRLRSKGQVTIPASIIRHANLVKDTLLEVQLIDGVIILKPLSTSEKRNDTMKYAGIFKGAWGNKATKINSTISDLRDEWERGALTLLQSQKPR
jgi:bifunctional DNA-binding transcriptional regulator/antitoxin component of YhaV-PrlF toxin-antitoxin module